MAERAAEKLRQDRRYCRMISVWLHGYGQKGYTDSPVSAPDDYPVQGNFCNKLIQSDTLYRGGTVIMCHFLFFALIQCNALKYDT